MNKFIILLYKDFLIRKRQYVITAFEFLSPIFFACVPLLLLYTLNDRPDLLIHEHTFDEYYESNQSTWPKVYTDYFDREDPFTIPLSFQNETTNLYYTPSNFFTDIIMQRAIEIWNSNTGFHGVIELRNFSSELELESTALVLSSYPMKTVGIIFHNLNIHKFPDSLDYTIRCGDVKKSNTFRINMKFKYKESDFRAYSDSLFLSWQTAVEESFIEVRSSGLVKPSFNYSISLQRFPGFIKKVGSVMKVMDVWPLLFSVGFLIFAVIITRRIILEKVNGLQALMTAMGLSRFEFWMSCFTNYFISGIVITFIICVIYEYPLSTKLIVFRNTKLVSLWGIMSVFTVNLILFCFVLSIFVDNFSTAVLLFIMIYAMTFTLFIYYKVFGIRYSAYINFSYASKLFLCILPMSSVFYAFEIIIGLETMGRGIKFSDILTYEQILEFDVAVLFNGQLICFISLTLLLWYFDAVWPFQDRISHPFYFPFTIHYWFGSCYRRKTEINVDLKLDSEYFEPDSQEIGPGIIIQNLTKRFDTVWSSQIVIDNISLKINAKNIAVLLGHKKSGKTTLVKILSGLSNITSGKIFVDDLDLSFSACRIRKDLGVCFQNNVLYENLSVHEHLQIFAGLKGVNMENINEQSLAIQELMLLSEERNNISCNLSDECKRKLSLGLAIIGGSNILILDQPTLNLSSAAKYRFWNVLLTLKQNCCILLTSCCAEDFYTFADKIAFLSYGQLQFCGSPEYLKKKFGTGYRLHVTKDDCFEIGKLMKLIQEYYSDVIVEKNADDFIIFNFQSDVNVRLGCMFEKLEKIKGGIGVKSFGISHISMEDVFMNEPYLTFLKNKSADPFELEQRYMIEDTEGFCHLQKSIHKSWNLTCSRLLGLLYKNLTYALRLWHLCLLRILAPFILICCTFQLLHTYMFTEYPSLKLDIKTMYKNKAFGFVETYSDSYNISNSIIQNELLSVMEENFVSVYTHKHVSSIVDLYTFTHYPTYVTGLLIGANVHSQLPSDFVVWYNGEHYHTLPIALNLFHTAMLRKLTGNGSIYLKNHPLPYTYMTFSEYDTVTQRTVIICTVPIISAFIGATYVLIPTYEKASKIKLLQLRSGLSIRLYWLSMFLWDFGTHIFTCFFMIVAVSVANTIYFFHIRTMGALFFIFFIFGWCVIPMSYLISLMSVRPTAVYVYMWLFHAVTGYFYFVIDFMEMDISEVGVWILRFLPSFNLTEGFCKVFYAALTHSYCDNIIPREIIDIHCNKNITDNRSQISKCCDSCVQNCGRPVNIVIFTSQHLYREILAMFVLGIIFIALLILIEAALYQSYKGCIPLKTIIPKYSDSKEKAFSSVYFEKERIEDLLASGNHAETLMVLDITKYYGNLCALNGLTFGVNSGNCLVIIGGYAAGKSTLLKILAGEICPNAGTAFIGKYNFINNLKKFQSSVGYCPEYDILLNHLTGREMLRFYSRLNGQKSSQDLESIVIEMIQLGDHADKLIKHYSYANKRKLITAVAIIGCPPVILMDEPTTGIDFKSQRIIWNLLNMMKHCHKSAIIFSSISIFECRELFKLGLCDRLAIINDGNFHCFGTLEELEEKYDSGKIVKILLKLEHRNLSFCIFEIKRFFETNVPRATLIKYHEGAFTYHVKESFLTLSALFHIMDYMKIKFNLHKYLITDSSLDQICFVYTEALRRNCI